jgi:hypothetical protein
MTKTVTLYAPPEYIAARPDVRAQVANGCGPGGWLGELVPETIWGVPVSAACDIHDWMYVMGKTQADKEEADDVFRNNLLRLISAAGGPWWLRWLRQQRVLVYYEAVQHFGGPLFWQSKNPKSHKFTAAFMVSRTWFVNWDSLLLRWLTNLWRHKQ